MATRESWDKVVAAQMVVSNDKKREGIKQSARSTWEAPAKLSDEYFDKTSKHEFSLKMRFARAGLDSDLITYNGMRRQAKLVGE